MLDVFKKLVELLDRRERRRGILVLLLLMVVAIGDAVGVASIMPFMAVLANPDVIDTNRFLSFAFEVMGFESREAFLHFLGVFFFVMLLVALSLQALGTWAQFRFSEGRNHRWGVRLLQGYLRQPYEWFLTRHSSELSTSILAEVQEVVGGVLFPAMRIIANSLVVLLLIGLLISVDPLLSVAMAGGVGGGFWLVQVLVRRKLDRIGYDRREANRERYRTVQEAFGGIKDVKILGREQTFVDRFFDPSATFADRRIRAGLIREIPPLAMQGLLFGGLLLALLYLMRAYDGFEGAVPIAAVFAFAGYRLLPAIQRIYQDVSLSRYSLPALDALVDDMRIVGATYGEGRHAEDDDVPSKLSLRKAVTFERLSYRYPQAEKDALDCVDLTIGAFMTVGLVGTTGSGKTTIADVLLGLLQPSSGRMLVDDQEVTGAQLRSWQRSVGYVPQQIFLSDDSVASNIAFGFPTEVVDRDAVEQAARVANLHDFVTEELPQGYDTLVGERGVKLSGGQRQRIGIARALYHDPDILILDEATSALDNLTEQAVMEAVRNIGNRKTIVLVAHRLSTVEACDRIFMLEQGSLVAQGSFDELLDTNERFRAMARRT